MWNVCNKYLLVLNYLKHFRPWIPFPIKTLVLTLRFLKDLNYHIIIQQIQLLYLAVVLYLEMGE